MATYRRLTNTEALTRVTSRLADVTDHLGRPMTAQAWFVLDADLVTEISGPLDWREDAEIFLARHLGLTDPYVLLAEAWPTSA